MGKIGYKDTLNSQSSESPLTAKDKTVGGKLLNFYTFGLSGAAGDAIKKRKAKRAAKAESDPVKKARQEGRAERKELRQTRRDEKKAVRMENRATRRADKAVKVKAKQDKRTKKLKEKLEK